MVSYFQLIKNIEAHNFFKIDVSVVIGGVTVDGSADVEGEGLPM